MLVKLDHFPKVRDENSKHIWVATTKNQLSSITPPSGSITWKPLSKLSRRTSKPKNEGLAVEQWPWGETWPLNQQRQDSFHKKKGLEKSASSFWVCFFGGLYQTCWLLHLRQNNQDFHIMVISSCWCKMKINLARVHLFIKLPSLKHWNGNHNHFHQHLISVWLISQPTLTPLRNKGLIRPY